LRTSLNKISDYSQIGTDPDFNVTDATCIALFHPTYNVSAYAGNIIYITAGLGNHMFYTTSAFTFRMIIANSGNVGIGTAVPNYKLEVVAGTGTTGAITNTYFRVSTALTTSAVAIADVCAKFNSSIWIAGGSVVASSDIRIKEDIQDINDDNALNMILAIEPKTYKYIDKVAKGDN